VARLLDPADINAPADTATGRHTNDAAHQVAYSALARAEFLLEGSDHHLNEHPEEDFRLTREWFDRFVRDRGELPDLEPHGD
jgi:hypothetical protein